MSELCNIDNIRSIDTFAYTQESKAWKFGLKLSNIEILQDLKPSPSKFDDDNIR